jgi:hypothetical protein
MLIDQAQTIELPGRQPGYLLSHGIVVWGTPLLVGGVGLARRLLQSKTHPARHLRHSPSDESGMTIMPYPDSWPVFCGFPRVLCALMSVSI